MGTKTPAWFWIVTLLLVAWNGFGVYLFIQETRLGADAMGPASAADHAAYAALPGWYFYVYAVAIFAAMLGALALLLKERRSVTLFVISFVAMLITFGYYFVVTHPAARHSAGEAYGMPAFVVAVALFSIWFSRLAARRGWIGR